jgi:hypothetical protein
MAGFNNGIFSISFNAFSLWGVVMPGRRLVPCFQVSVRFAFVNHKAVLVSTHTKPQMAMSFLVKSGIPIGSGLTHSRFFATEKEAAQFVSQLHAVYRGRIIPNPPLPGGQLSLF